MPERCKTPLAAANLANLKQNILNIFRAANQQKNQKQKSHKTNRNRERGSSNVWHPCEGQMNAHFDGHWAGFFLFIMLTRSDFPHYLRQIFKVLAAF